MRLSIKKKQVNKITIVEKNLLGSHTSGHTTAKNYSFTRSYLSKTCKTFIILKQLISTIKSQKEAMKGIKDLIEKEKIDCCLKRNVRCLYIPMI